MTDAEKLSDYQRIVEIIEEQLALQRHLRQKRANFEQVQFSQVDAYSHIVDIVAGRSALLCA